MAPEAVSQPVNGGTVHDWGQLCRFEGKIRAHFGSFTKSDQRVANARITRATLMHVLALDQTVFFVNDAKKR